MARRYSLEDEGDFVIVGSGAGGATAARVLTEAGFSVVIVEEGPWLTGARRPQSMLESLCEGFRAMGTLTTVGKAPIPILQGCCVGGSTAINSGIIWRMPEDVQQDWASHYGLAELVEAKNFERIFERLERELHVAPTSSEVLGGNAEAMAMACRSLGLPGRPTARNAARCQGSAQCILGCPHQAKQSMDVSYVPRAMEHGARVHELCRARRVILRGSRAVEVRGEVLDREARRARARFRIGARRGVILAAGAVHTPLILWRSGLRRNVGDYFQAHPGAALVARFDRPIGMAFGGTQGYEVPLRNRGYKLESLALPPGMLAARIPGAGSTWQQRLAELDHYAQWAVQVRMRALGRVRPGLSGGPSVHYVPLPEDLETLREALSLLVRMMFAAGATEVYPGLGGMPDVLRREPHPHDPHVLGPLGRHNVHLIASHLFGTSRAGADPRYSVVDPHLETHEVKGLYVMDASVFPTNMGVNPQHSIMAVVWRAAEWLANEHRLPHRAAA